MKAIESINAVREHLSSLEGHIVETQSSDISLEMYSLIIIVQLKKRQSPTSRLVYIKLKKDHHVRTITDRNFN